MRALVAAAVLAAALSTGPVATASHCGTNVTCACNADPECNGGRGSVAAFICIRSEVNPLTNEFNGRVCTWSQGQGTWYFYLRWVQQREPVTICRNGQQVFPAANPSNTSTCQVFPWEPSS